MFRGKPIALAKSRIKSRTKYLKGRIKALEALKEELKALEAAATELGVKL